jgi:sulfate adenylyltransferase
MTYENIQETRINENYINEQIVNNICTKTIEVSKRAYFDTFMLGIGAFSPLQGFIDKTDYQSILDNMTLKSGHVFSIPIVLSVTQDNFNNIQINQNIKLTHENKTLGMINVKEKFLRDLEQESIKVYQTNDLKHPGIKKIHEEGPYTIAGKIQIVFENFDNYFKEHFLTPLQTKEYFKQKGWNEIVAFQTRNPIHRAHEYLTKIALETVDGLMIHPIVGELKPDDIPAHTRMQCYKTIIENYYNKDKVLLNTLPMAMRYAGPREAIHHALVRQNYGITHIIIGRDHAGVGNYYGTYDAQDIFKKVQHKLKIRPIKVEHAFFCKSCDRVITQKTCNHSKENHIFLSGTKVREKLRNNEDLPEEFTRKEVSLILKDWIQKEQQKTTTNPNNAKQNKNITWHSSSISKVDREKVNNHKAAIIWFTGLPSSGKSTLSFELEKKLFEKNIQIYRLDGDNVRHGLNKNLGFSKEDRNENIRRISEVAKLFYDSGKVTLVSFVSPFTKSRQEARELIENNNFIEIFVKTNLQTCIKRDPKGLYKKAIEGIIPQFTGISDPYEDPTSPELIIDTDQLNIEQSIEKILNYLEENNILQEKTILN